MHFGLDAFIILKMTDLVNPATTKVKFIASKHHVSEMIELSEEDRNAFIADVNHVAKAMHAAFHPDKVNYGAYGDTGHHLHFHLVPKYKDEFEWGGTFAMDPKQKTLTNAEYDILIAELKKYL